jgi:dihydrofolate reductase
MIAAIFSIDQVGGMGTNGTLPWAHHQEDMTWFKELTEGHVVIMGRKTWDDPKMPKPLPNRINYIITTRPRQITNAFTLGDDWLSQIPKIQARHPGKKIFIIGGSNVLESSRSLIDFAYVTHRKGNHRCDVRLNWSDYTVGLRALSARPSTDKVLNFMVYRDIESDIPLHEGLH